MTTEVRLHNGMVALVDDEDAPLVTGKRWHASQPRPGYWYADRFERVAGKMVRIPMHRVLTGAVEGQLVDHRNRDTLDNRRANLRICNYQQNRANSKPHNKASRFKGVWPQRHGWWGARIRVSGKTFHLGRFPSERAAAEAYDKAASVAFGEFAALNRDIAA